MNFRQVSRDEFAQALGKYKIEHSMFIGYHNLDDCDTYHYYLVSNNRAGFAIDTSHRELFSVFNVDPDYHLLKDDSVIKFINDNVDLLVCIGYYIATDSGEPIRKDISSYYNETLGFNVFGRTTEDVEDMIQTRGLNFTAEFVKRYGLPYQVFMVNPKFGKPEKERLFGHNGYDWAMGRLSYFIDGIEEDD